MLYARNLFSVLHINCRSLYKNYIEIETLLQSFLFKFKIIALTETWFNSEDNVDRLFEDYIYKGTSRTGKRGGGVGFCIHNQISFNVRHDLHVFNDLCESFFIEIPKRGKNLLIGVFYRPPSYSIDQFVHVLTQSLNDIESEHKDCILLGDFNVDLTKVDVSNSVNVFLESLYSCSFYPLIEHPTRITETSATLIDNIFVNFSHDILSGTILSDISDHLPIFSCFDFIFNDKWSLSVKRRNMCTLNFNKFICKLSKLNFNYHITSMSDPNVIYDDFIKKVSLLYESCFPLEECIIKQCNEKWFTSDLKKMSSKKDCLYRKCLKHPSDYRKRIYKLFKNKYVKAIKKAKRIFLYRNSTPSRGT